MEKKTKHTPAPWSVKHSESKTAFNIIGSIGHKYKIARFPYVESNLIEQISIDNREFEQAKANSLLASNAPDMIEFLQSIVSDYESGFTEDIRYYAEKAHSLIKKATGDE